MIKIVAISASIVVAVVGGYCLYNYNIQQNKKILGLEKILELEKTKFHQNRLKEYNDYLTSVKQ